MAEEQLGLARPFRAHASIPPTSELPLLQELFYTSLILVLTNGDREGIHLRIIQGVFERRIDSTAWQLINFLLFYFFLYYISALCILTFLLLMIWTTHTHVQ